MLKSLLIVDDNPRICQELAALFSADGRFGPVSSVLNASEATLLFAERAPDIAVVDMLMPICDGVELITKLKEAGLGKKTLFVGISSLCTDVFLRMCQNIGLSYVVAMPTEPEVIYRRVCDAAFETEEPNSVLLSRKAEKRMIKMEEIISRYLMAIGVCAHHDGFAYLKYGIALCVDQRDKNIGITTYVYPEIAKRFNVSIKVVERSIRYAIDVAWLRGDVEAQHKLFGYTVAEDKGRPTNKECMTLIAERTRIRLKHNDM